MYLTSFVCAVSHSSQVHTVRITDAEQFEGAVVSVRLRLSWETRDAARLHGAILCANYHGRIQQCLTCAGTGTESSCYSFEVLNYFETHSFEGSSLEEETVQQQTH